MVLPLLPAIAIASLLLLAVPVYLPRAALWASSLLVAAAIFFALKPPAPPTAKFNWGLDRPLAVIIALYAALWIGTALVSRSRDRAAVLDERGADQVRGAPAV